MHNVAHKVKLWTVRPESDFFILEKQGGYRTDETRVPYHRIAAYTWISEYLAQKVPPPKGVIFPVWAWYRAHGLRQPRPDLRKTGHLQHKERGVRIEFDIPKEQVLLSNFDAWHSVLNNHCCALTDAEYEYYERLERLSSPEAFHAVKLKSWEKIFDLSLLTNPEVDEIQAIFWELKLDWVTKVDFFVAR